MKKRYIALIAIPTACLLFASLIYCAISSFPELLEFDKKEEEIDETKEGKQLFVEEKITYDSPKEVTEPIVVFDAIETTDTVYCIEFDEVETPSFEVGSIENNTPITVDLSFEEVTSIKEQPVSVEQDNVEESVSDVVIENIEELVEDTKVVEVFEEEINYISSNRYYVETVSNYEINIEEKENWYLLEDGENEVVVCDTVATPVNKHYEVLECTLLVVGIVELLSLLLIRRKKNRSFHI